MIDKSKLSASTAAVLAAHEFRTTHPEFYPVRRNWDTLDTYMDRHKMGRSLDAYEKAYSAVYSQILTKGEAIELMSPEEVKQFAQAYGKQVFDPTTGKSLGWDFPDEVAAPSAPVLTQRNSLGHTVTARTAPKQKERTRQPSVTRPFGDFISR